MNLAINHPNINPEKRIGLSWIFGYPKPRKVYLQEPEKHYEKSVQKKSQTTTNIQNSSTAKT